MTATNMCSNFGGKWYSSPPPSPHFNDEENVCRAPDAHAIYMVDSCLGKVP